MFPPRMDDLAVTSGRLFVAEGLRASDAIPSSHRAFRDHHHIDAEPTPNARRVHRRSAGCRPGAASRRVARSVAPGGDHRDRLAGPDRRVTGHGALGSAITALLGLVAASAGAAPLAGFLILTSAGLGLAARRWLSLAQRSRIGAQSEDEVQRVLAPLEAEGWRLRHSLPWQGRGGRLGGDRPHRVRRCDRDENEDLRRAPPCPRARAGSVVVAAPAKMVSPRRARRAVPRPDAWGGA